MSKWFQPQYFKAFSCKCGQCRHACCKGWNIAVTEAEYYQMIGYNCSEELHHRIECAFGIPSDPTPDRFRLIEPNWLGECHMLDRDGLCLLQKELGASAIPELCQVYPRSLKAIQVSDADGSIIEKQLRACCTGSCERVIELLMQRGALANVEAELDEAYRPEMTVTHLADEIDLQNKVLELLGDKSVSLVERSINVANFLGCEIDADYIKSEHFFHEVLDSLKIFLEECPSLDSYVTELFERYDSEMGYGRYINDIEHMCRLIPDYEEFFYNFLMNNMIFSDFPYCDRRLNTKQVTAGIIEQVYILSMVCGCHLQYDESIEGFVDAAAVIYHLVEHTAFYYNSFVLYKNNKIVQGL